MSKDTEKVASRPTKNPEATRCDFYLELKKRFCRAEKGKGSDFCGAHREDGTRAPCPINPNHSVYKTDLEKHVLVCPDLKYRPEGKPYHSKGVNGRRSCRDIMGKDGGSSADLDATPPYSMYKKHKQLSPEDLQMLLNKVSLLYGTLVQPGLSDDFIYEPTGAELETLCDIDEHEAVDAEGNTTTTAIEGQAKLVRDQHSGHKTQKHTPQHIGLLNQLVTVGCLPIEFHSSHGGSDEILGDQLSVPENLLGKSSSDTPKVLLELGAGKAGLVMALREKLATLVAAPKPSTKVQQLSSSTTIVVDRGNFRHKKDGCYSLSESPFHRLRLDIQDFVLNGVEEVKKAVSIVTNPDDKQNSERNGGTLGLGKHLCGGCTDFALNSLLLAPYSSTKPQSVVIATCCHHLCDPAMVHSWACGLVVDDDDDLLQTERRTKRGRDSPASGADEKVVEAFKLYQSLTVDDWSSIISLTSWGVCGDRVTQAQQDSGRMAKRLIDWTRMKHVVQFVPQEEAIAQKEGKSPDVGPRWSGALRHFVPQRFTKENACILLWR